MSAELVLDVSLVTGEYGASAPDGNPEWPPHPYRLFAALVAAAGAGRSAEETACLEALERLSPPRVEVADTVAVSPRHRVHVPSAKKEMLGKRAPHWADRVVWPAHDQVRFRWHGEQPALERRVLENLARRVAYLGRAKTLVIITVPDNPAPMPAGTLTWVPDRGLAGEVRLRVPTAGLLRELDQDYESGVRADSRKPAFMHGYRRAGQLAAPAEGPWGTIGAWRLASGSIPPTYALVACDALRSAALSREGDSCPPEISGHAPAADGTSSALPSPHAAWLPLVDAGHDHASGRLLGFGVAVPPGVRLPDMPQQFRVGFRRITIMPVDESRRPPIALTPWRWARPSQCWASVTPVVLPWRGTRPDPRAAERAVKAACVKAGFPRPVQVVVDDVPFIRGPGRAQDYLRARPGETARRACHAIVRFDAEVRGPVILGPLRYFGLGLMAPYEAVGRVDRLR